MARPFTAHRGGRVELRLDEREADVLRQLLGNLEMTLGSGETTGDVRRLFPPAYPEDEDAQHEFASLTLDDLREGKRVAIVRCIETLDAAKRKGTTLIGDLDDERQQAWLGTLNDLRLYLGTRLGVTEEAYDRDVAEDDPRSAPMHLYLYLGWLQENLVEVLLG